MDTYRKIDAEVSAAEPEDGAQWEEIGREVSARLKEITQNVKCVLAQEGYADKEVEYDEPLVLSHR